MVGPEAEMSLLEQMIIAPRLSRVLQRVPEETLERSAGWADTVLLAGALLMWSSRVARMVLPKPKEKPTSAMPQETVGPDDGIPPHRPSEGGKDVNGIAAPVSDEIYAIMAREGNV